MIRRVTTNQCDKSVERVRRSQNYLSEVLGSLEDELMVVNRDYLIMEANRALFVNRYMPFHAQYTIRHFKQLR